MLRRGQRTRQPTIRFVVEPVPERKTTRKTSKAHIKKGLINNPKLLKDKRKLLIQKRKNITIKKRIESIKDKIEKNKEKYKIPYLNLDDHKQVERLLSGINLGVDKTININIIILFAKNSNQNINQYDLNDPVKLSLFSTIVRTVLKNEDRPQFDWRKKMSDIKQARANRNRMSNIYSDPEKYQKYIETTIRDNIEANKYNELNLNDSGRSGQIAKVLRGAVYQGCNSYCRDKIIRFTLEINQNHIYVLDENTIKIFCDIVWNIVNPFKPETTSSSNSSTTSHTENALAAAVAATYQPDLEEAVQAIAHAAEITDRRSLPRRRKTRNRSRSRSRSSTNSSGRSRSSGRNRRSSSSNTSSSSSSGVKVKL